MHSVMWPHHNQDIGHFHHPRKYPHASLKSISSPVFSNRWFAFCQESFACFHIKQLVFLYIFVSSTMAETFFFLSVLLTAVSSMPISVSENVVVTQEIFVERKWMKQQTNEWMDEPVCDVKYSSYSELWSKKFGSPGCRRFHRVRTFGNLFHVILELSQCF